MVGGGVFGLIEGMICGVAAMKTSKVVLTLEQEDLLELQAVVTDSDAEAALEFLRKRILPKIPAKGTAPCDSSRLNPFLLKPDNSD